jgi:hypothetical protein
MSNLDRDLAEMRRLGYSSYGKYKLDHPNTGKSVTEPPPKKPRQCALPKEYHLVCDFCGKPFISPIAQKMYCSTECRRKNAKKKYRDRKLSESQKRIAKCLICGREFQQLRSSHKYCGGSCKRTANLEIQRQWRARLKEAQQCSTITK